MNRILFLLVLIPVSGYPMGEVVRDRMDIVQGGLPRLALKVDNTIDAILQVALVNMRAKDSKSASADKIESEWNGKFHGMLLRTVGITGVGDIGDHKPLLDWLAKAYDLIEISLGAPLCKSLHISDIKTLNFCINVVFSPCSFPMDGVTGTRRDEYARHFAKGNDYYGLTPVVTYWGITIGCWVGTSGVGAMACGAAASAAEWTMGNLVAPPLSNFVYIRACGG